MKLLKKLQIAALLSSSLLFSSCLLLDLDIVPDFMDITEAILSDSDALDYDNSENKTARVVMTQKIIQTAKDATAEYSSEDEYEIGRSVSASVVNQFEIYTDAPDFTRYLNKICQTIVENSDAPNLYNGYHVAIIDSDEINALSSPSGHIFISRGLINCSDSEDTLAAIIAHEIAHIQLKHGIKAIKTSRTVSSALDIGRDMLNNSSKVKKFKNTLSRFEIEEDIFNDFASTVSSLADTLINSGFSKEQEYEADELALSLLADAGYDPTALIEMLKQLPCDKIDGELLSGWDKTHPKPKERILNVQISISSYSPFNPGKKYRGKRYNNEIRGIK